MSANRFDRWVGSYAEAVIRGRWLVLVLTLLAVGFAASGARFLALKNDYKMWFSPQDPELLAFEQLQNTYTKNDNLLFVVTPKDGHVFTADTLAAIERMTEAAWKLPYAMRVDSVTNFPYSHAEGDDLVVDRLVRDAAKLAPEDLAEKRALALAEPALKNFLLNADASVTGINVTFQFPRASQDEEPASVAAARALVDEIHAAHPNLELRLTGGVMLNHAFSEAAMKDMSSLIPLMYLIILVVMVVMLRSFTATLATTGIIVFSVLTSLGCAGWLGLPVTPPMASTPTIIMTLAVADSVHVFVVLFEGMRQGLSKHEALKHSVVHNAYPMFLTAITTAIGFLTMDTAEAPPFRDLGYVVAIGVTAAWVFSMLFLPALIAVLPIKPPKPGRAPKLGMDRFGHWVVARRKPLLWGSLAVSLVLLAMVPRNELNDEFVKYFDESIPFRADTDYTLTHLTGVNQVQFSLPAGTDGGVADPAFLAKLDAFASWLRAQPEVVHVAAISDTFKRLNKNMHGDDPAAYRLPEDRALAAQYLLLYELSLPYGLDLNNQLNVDKSATQVIVTANTVSSNALRGFTERAEGWLKANAPAMATKGSGTPVMFAHISERNITSMLKGTLIGLALISLLLILAFKSVRLGLISLIPNLLPAGLAFGLWGMLVGQVNLAVSVVAGVTFGIVVDDTIHFLSLYMRARREEGMDAADAVRHGFSHAGVALITTTVILVAGFTVLSFSSFGINASMAQLSTVAFIIAMLGDFLLLPPLLMLLDRRVYAPAKETAHALAH